MIGDDARSHAAIIRLDQRHHHAVLVGGGQIDRVAVMQTRIAGSEIRIGVRKIDQLAALVGIGVRQQTFHRHMRECRIGIPFGEVFVGQALGLEHRRQRVGRARAHLLQIVAFEDLQHLQNRRALAVGRQFVHVIAAIVDRERRHPFAVMRREILVAQIAADALEISVDRVRDLAFVERVAAALGDQRISVREIGIAEDFAFFRRVTARRIGRARVVEFFDQALVLLEQAPCCPSSRTRSAA